MYLTKSVRREKKKSKSFVDGNREAQSSTVLICRAEMLVYFFMLGRTPAGGDIPSWDCLRCLLCVRLLSPNRGGRGAGWLR